MTDTLIRALLGLMLVLFFVMRVYHHRKAETEGGKIDYREPNRLALRLIRLTGGFVLLGATAAFFAWPALIRWAAIPFPEWLRWAGLGLGYLSLPLIWWTEASLGLNFNTTLHVREGHTLVTHGPYRWVRHPMYTALYLLSLSWLLASANWLVGLPGLVGLTIILINRLGREEATMIEVFGDQYRGYMQRTGRFLPRLAR